MGTMLASHRDPMDVCGRMLSCRKFDDVSERILQPLAECLSAQTASFRQFHLNGKTFAIGHNACHQVADRSHEEYASYFYRMDPVLEYGMAPGGRLGNLSRFGYDLFCLADICDYRRLIRSEYYQEFFQPNHIHHVLVLAFRLFGHRDQVALLGFHRPSDAPQFTKSDVMRARYFAPAALSALHGMTVDSALEKSRVIVDSLERASKDVGVLLLGGDGSLLYANEPGAAAFALTRDEFGDFHHGAGDSLFEGLWEFCRRSDWETPEAMRDGKSIDLKSTGGRSSLRVRAQPLMRDGRLSAWLVMTEGEAGADTAMRDKLSSLGLTAREQDIARLLARGASNQDIADQLGISVRTTENHLRSIYSKVGVNSRSQMISRLFNVV
jgi:DNA-binding CsgD family transcriptional regulator